MAGAPSSGARSIAYIGSLTAGMKIGIQMIAGRYFHCWLDQDLGDGWEWLMAQDMGTLMQFNIGHPYRPTLWVSGTESGADDFGGGHICFPPNFIRRGP